MDTTNGCAKSFNMRLDEILKLIVYINGNSYTFWIILLFIHKNVYFENVGLYGKNLKVFLDLRMLYKRF